MKNFIAALSLLAFFSPLPANSQIILSENIRWAEDPLVRGSGPGREEIWTFQGAVISERPAGLPFLVRRFAVGGVGRLRVQVTRSRYEAFDWPAPPAGAAIGEELRFETAVEREAGRTYGKLAFVPIVRRGGRYERLVEVELRVDLISTPEAAFRDPTDNTRNSVLSEGLIYRVAVTRTGLHKLTSAFLRTELGIDIDRVDPRRIQIFGNGGGMLPEPIAAGRIDDLTENHIFVAGQDDGRFDAADYILFYAEGPDVWRYDAREGQFNQERNIYDTRNYYFIRIGVEEGRRLVSRPSLDLTEHSTDAFDDFARWEEDRLNLLHEWRPLTQGSDRRWYNTRFRNQREYRFDDLFTFPNLAPGETARVKVEMALRALVSSRFTVEVNGRALTSSTARRVDRLIGEGANEIAYADTATVLAAIPLDRPDVDVVVRYPNPGGANDGSEGWLDYIQVNARRRLILGGDPLVFRDTRTLAYASTTFQLSGASDRTVVWDVTDPLRPVLQEVALSGDRLRFGAATTALRTFLAFRDDGNFPAPQAAGRVENQNLHGLDNLDMVIVHHADFADAAQLLAAHRQKAGNLEVAAVRVDQIYNEFSSGRQDPTAIRDFARMLYQRNPRFRFLALLGDGSFDYRDIYGLGANFIPVYETVSFDPITAFPSDDYYSLLDDNVPGNALGGAMDIAVGRLPAKTAAEATGLVNKIINYETNPQSLGDWRNRVLFIADDEDGMLHHDQAEAIADTVARRYDFLNLDKVFLDAFPQVATPTGGRFPAATEAINQNVFRGVLAMTYLGHGGAQGLAEERVVEIPDILNWRNYNQPPLLVTATCSFAGYDDPAFTTAGETAILNERGGAIALMTTVRAVFSSQNAALTLEVMRTLFERPDGRVQTIGEAMVRAKNRLTSFGTLTNSRKFTLLGDPAMRLALPEQNVVTTRVNAQDITGGRLDTLRALQRVTIEGEVTGPDGRRLESFNGILYPTLFDKPVLARTLAQDPGSRERLFDLQKNVIFKGRATVQNGRFQFTFVVPKDINYLFGRGKVSYYAADEQQREDAAGAYQDIIIGGTDPNALADRQGPRVEVFMNTEDFAFGGITDENPTLLVLLSDDNGINVVGNSIGHDLEAILDDDTQNSLLLNDFYESELDDYTRGKVRYPLSRLEEGRHTMKVKAWDVANNSSQGYTEFVVASSAEIALEHVLNYPNPFTDRTCFQFDHNLANQELEVQVQIFTISGRLVKTLEQTIFSDGAIRQDDCIEWDGRDDYGDRLARGVYLYRVRVRTANTGDTVLEGESSFEKLVLLK